MLLSSGNFSIHLAVEFQISVVKICHGILGSLALVTNRHNLQKPVNLRGVAKNLFSTPILKKSSFIQELLGAAEVLFVRDCSHACMRLSMSFLTRAFRK